VALSKSQYELLFNVFNDNFCAPMPHMNDDENATDAGSPHQKIVYDYASENANNAKSMHAEFKLDWMDMKLLREAKHGDQSGAHLGRFGMDRLLMTFTREENNKIHTTVDIKVSNLLIFFFCSRF